MIQQKMKLNSPLRYPGGKQKAIALIAPLFPKECKEYREPFVGGGSVFLHALKTFDTDTDYWINDKNSAVCSFWSAANQRPTELIDSANLWYDRSKGASAQITGRQLYQKLLKELEEASSISIENRNIWYYLTEAVRFFVLNRITFSGTIESGGFSQKAFDDRFTASSLERLAFLCGVISDRLIAITNHDFEVIISTPRTAPTDEDVFIFLDPPYASNEKSKLYGSKGDLHAKFDHERLAIALKETPYQWLMTYDDCEKVRDLYRDFYIRPFSLQYGMNNVKKKNAKKGEELFISNRPFNQ